MGQSTASLAVNQNRGFLCGVQNMEKEIITEIKRKQSVGKSHHIGKSRGQSQGKSQSKCKSKSSKATKKPVPNKTQLRRHPSSLSQSITSPPIVAYAYEEPSISESNQTRITIETCSNHSTSDSSIGLRYSISYKKADIIMVSI